MAVLYEVSGYTDAGPVRAINQDAMLAQVALTSSGNVALLAVADGIGGLSRGELASATTISMLEAWFATQLPTHLMHADLTSISETFLDDPLIDFVQTIHQTLCDRGARESLTLGTTLTSMLVVGRYYTLIHVGDTRAYEITDGHIRLLTRDQTFVQREIDAGRLDAQEAATHPLQNALLQGLGFSKHINPDITHGEVVSQATYLLCSDGFRHRVSEDEMRGALCFGALNAAWRQHGKRNASGQRDRREDLSGDERSAIVLNRLEALGHMAAERGETDNMSAVALWTQEDDDPWR